MSGLKEDKITVDVLDYLGKFDDGVISIISLGYKGTYYEASFFYKENIAALTPDERLEDELGCQIEDFKDYNELMLSILKKVVPYNEIINIIDDFNPEKYGI